MVYNRLWFASDQFALTLGGGAINNPGRYLVLMPPINGATAFSGTPYFTASPGDPYKAWDASVTFDYMPNQFATFRVEFNHRAANVPLFRRARGRDAAGRQHRTARLAGAGLVARSPKRRESSHVRAAREDIGAGVRKPP